MSPPPDRLEADARRLRALDTLDLIDAPPDAAFDALAALAARLLDCPYGAVTLIDAERQWVTGKSGDFDANAPREHAFCNRTIAEPGALLVEDATADPRHATSPLVDRPDGLRAYAGLAINATDPASGEAVPIGAVCGIDTHPRAFDPEQRAALDHLRTLAEALLEARALRIEAERSAWRLGLADRTFRQAERMAAIGSWRLELESEALDWSEGVSRIHEIPHGHLPPLSQALDFYPPRERAIVSAALANTIETGAPFDFEVDFVTARGRQRRVRSIGELELREGRAFAVVGVFQDVTEQHAVEESLRRSATSDPLTGIANRAAYTAALEAAMADGGPLSLLFVDLDHFKAINDTHGHLVGDEVVKAFARRLSRIEGLAARLGGDEFALVLSGPVAATVGTLAHRLSADLRRAVQTAAGPVLTSGTIGHAGWEAGMSLRELAHRADTALYAAKRRERGSIMGWGGLRAGDRRAA